jgi:hypothetical protein
LAERKVQRWHLLASRISSTLHFVHIVQRHEQEDAQLLDDEEAIALGVAVVR